MSSLSPEAGNNPEKRVPQWVIESLGDEAVSGVAIADEGGSLPKPANHTENFLRPVHRVDAFEPKVRGVRATREGALDTQSHAAAVEGTLETLKALDAKEFNIGHGNRNPRHAATEEEAENLRSTIGHLDTVSYRRSGWMSGRLRRRIDKTMRLNLRRPEEQVEEERTIALRTIGQIANFEGRMREVMNADEQAAELVKSHRPAALRQRLGDLAISDLIHESSPLHPRWSEQQDPKNIKALKYFMTSTSNESSGEDPKNMADHIQASGINGSVRPHIVAAYLGISYEEWDAQRYGVNGDRWQNFVKNWERRKEQGEVDRDPVLVPAEVRDQINFLIKLDGIAYEQGAGSKTTTALDKLIEYGAAKPWTEAPADPGHKNPMERILENRETLKQTEQAELARMKAQPILNQLNDIELVLADLPEDSREAAKLRDRKERLKRHLKKQGITTNGNSKGGEPQASAEAKRDLTEAERAQQEFLNSLSSNPVLRRLEIVNWLLKHGQDPELADTIMARHPAPPTRQSQPSTEGRRQSSEQPAGRPGNEQRRKPTQLEWAERQAQNPRYASLFDTAKLAKLHDKVHGEVSSGYAGAVSQYNARQQAAGKSEAVEKLPPAEFSAYSNAISERLTAKYLVDQGIDETDPQADTIRRAVTIIRLNNAQLLKESRSAESK